MRTLGIICAMAFIGGAIAGFITYLQANPPAGWTDIDWDKMLWE